MLFVFRYVVSKLQKVVYLRKFL